MNGIKCDLCDQNKLAVVDGRMKGRGTWAYMCKECFKLYGIGIGLGKGSKLKNDKEQENAKR